MRKYKVRRSRAIKPSFLAISRKCVRVDKKSMFCTNNERFGPYSSSLCISYFRFQEPLKSWQSSWTSSFSWDPDTWRLPLKLVWTFMFDKRQDIQAKQCPKRSSSTICLSFSLKGETSASLDRTLPKALRTQALTAATKSNIPKIRPRLLKTRNLFYIAVIVD